MKRRLGLALVIAAALGGLAAGLLVGHAHSGNALAQGPPRVMAKGTFRSLTWNTEGTASLIREPSGQLRLRLSSDFTTKHAPELYVYLAKLSGQQRTYWKQVGELKSTQGAQEYTVSGAATASGVQVAIYCGKCNQISGLAPLQPVPATS
jgi:hypothetical protein